jgi:Protein of unknown function (DUF2612)
MATEYTQLITSAHREQPKFIATVSLVTSAVASVTSALLAMPQQFSVDTAVGAQLDVVGLWVGMSRSVYTPVSDPYFSWDTATRGWDEGYWTPPYAPTEGVTKMDDATYRAALRLRIIANHWAGRQELFTGIPIRLEHDTDDNVIFAQDHFDMSVTFFVVGPAVSPVLKAVILQPGVLPKPMGVRIRSIIFTPAPVFGLDFATHTISGPDFGAFLF